MAVKIANLYLQASKLFAYLRTVQKKLGYIHASYKGAALGSKLGL